MTASHRIQLRCDRKSSALPDQVQLHCYTVTTVRASSYSRARLLARSDGWSHKDGKDFCPEHGEGSQF